MKSLNIKNLIITSFLLVSSSLFCMMPHYQNKITKIQEIHGATTYTIVLRASAVEPIVVYAPATFKESLDSSQIRFFLPNTTVDENLENLSKSLKPMANGVEILLFGELLNKVVSEGLIALTVKVK